MKGSFKTALIAALVSAFVAAGAAVATTKTFVLGTSNTVDAASTVTAGSSGLNAKLLQLTNNSTGSSATALGLTTPSSRPPMIVSSQAKVANLNADKLDGVDSTGFLRSPIANAYSVFDNDMTTCDSTQHCNGHLVLRNLPAGAYVISAKTIYNYVNQGADLVGGSIIATCSLMAGIDSDQAQAEVYGDGSAPPGQGARIETLPMQVVHTFTSTGQVDLACDDQISAGSWLWAKITAIRVGAISNVQG
jgi:hypothetical protein